MSICDGCGLETDTTTVPTPVHNGGTPAYTLCAPCADARAADPLVMVGPLSTQRVLHLSEVVRQWEETGDPAMHDALDQYAAAHDEAAIPAAYARVGLAAARTAARPPAAASPAAATGAHRDAAAQE